jgi:hypothetical protein
MSKKKKLPKIKKPRDKKPKSKYTKALRVVYGLRLQWDLIWPLARDPNDGVNRRYTHDNFAKWLLIDNPELMEISTRLLETRVFTYGVIISVHCKYEDGTADERIKPMTYRGNLDGGQEQIDAVIKELYSKCNMNYYSHTSFDVSVFKDSDESKVLAILEELIDEDMAA